MMSHIFKSKTIYKQSISHSQWLTIILQLIQKRFNMLRYNSQAMHLFIAMHFIFKSNFAGKNQGSVSSLISFNMHCIEISKCINGM